MAYRKVYIDNASYENMIKHKNQGLNNGRAGTSCDFKLFYSDDWLLDSAVIDHIIPVKGNWDIYLVFAWSGNPLKLIKRKIKSCTSRKLALINGEYMRRLAAKDARGTVTIPLEAFDVCNN
ncbi:MAG: hypothetical protein AAF363_09730 [Bacteroidota bacterium]